MRYGVNTLLWTAGFDESNLDLLPRLREHGFDGVEVARFTFADFPAARIRQAIEREGLGVTFCTVLAGELSLVSGDAGLRARALTHLRDGIATAAALGASVMAGPFCAPVGQLLGRRRNADEWARAVEGLQSLGPTLDEHGVTLAVEPLNRFETYFLNTTEDGVRLCEEVGHPRIGLLFDTFHANIEERDVVAAVRTAGPYLRHFHACENDRGAPGSGHVPWAAVLAALREVGYDEWAVIESFGSNIPEIAAAASIWRDLAPEPEQIAWEGVQFLRGEPRVG